MRLARAEVLVAIGGKEAVGRWIAWPRGSTGLPEEDRPTLLRGLAEAHRRLGDLAGARRIMGGLVERTPDDLALRLYGFDLAYQAGDAAGMKAIIEAIGDKDEGHRTLGPGPLPPLDGVPQWSAGRGRARHARRGPEARRPGLGPARRIGCRSSWPGPTSRT